jgi:putative addiction module component (TIGR02574 family)
MRDPVLELAEKGRRLTPQQRSRLVDLLQESLVETDLPEVAAAWGREIERRIAAYKNGEVRAYDLEEVLEDARRIAP